MKTGKTEFPTWVYRLLPIACWAVLPGAVLEVSLPDDHPAKPCARCVVGGLWAVLAFPVLAKVCRIIGAQTADRQRSLANDPIRAYAGTCKEIANPFALPEGPAFPKWFRVFYASGFVASVLAAPLSMVLRVRQLIH